jgi:RNA polymerase-binding transcription factor DksA
MEKAILDRIKKDLLEKKAQLETELGVFTEETTDDDYQAKFPEYGDESDENAQEVSQYSTDIEAERVLENTLKDINKALKAIEKNTYGRCKYCNQEIEEKRLLVRPFSSSCVKCKTKLQTGA